MQFSLLSYGKEQREVKALCDDLGVTLISYSPLALGLLSGGARAQPGAAAQPTPPPSHPLPALGEYSNASTGVHLPSGVRGRAAAA